LLHIGNLYHNEFAGKLAELLVELTKSDHAPAFDGAKVFFANSGTEANEGALKTARKVGKDRWAKSTGKPSDDPSCDKHEIVCFENAFHGRSMGALSVTSNPKYQNPFKPLIPGVRVGKLNAQESIDNLISEKTCAVIVEPVQGEGGLESATVDWLKALRKKCDEVGAVLIFDEIQVCVML
jgi:acetylornithine aminotransferase